MHSARLQLIQRDVALQEFERRPRAVDRGDRGRPAGERVDREAAGVREAIEHCALFREFAQTHAICPLIEIETGLVTVRHVDFEDRARFVHEQRRRRRGAAQQAYARLQPFEREHIGIRALV